MLSFSKDMEQRASTVSETVGKRYGTFDGALKSTLQESIVVFDISFLVFGAGRSVGRQRTHGAALR
jgi:hypothetical protein